jgi:ankyrin repeat protein
MIGAAKNRMETLHEMGDRMIHIIRENGDFEEVKRLLGRGADPDAADHMNITALMYASIRGRKDFCELLIAKGANVKRYYAFGYTAITFAEIGQQWEIVALLQPYHNNGSKN